jgi:hypothetical protein
VTGVKQALNTAATSFQGARNLQDQLQKAKAAVDALAKPQTPRPVKDRTGRWLNAQKRVYEQIATYNAANKVDGNQPDYGRDPHYVPFFGGRRKLQSMRSWRRSKPSRYTRRKF